jgi:hypothetical protein
MIEKHKVLPQNIWNLDEKGFLIGICHASKRIVPTRSLKSGRIKGALQDGSREFITLLAAVSAEGDCLAPALIYQSDSGDLQDSWLEEFDESSQKAYFGASSTGWTSDELGLQWLERFEQQTKQQAASRKRLIILDGHSSHVNMAFIDRADAYRILIAVFPPHSTHRLQPLDVSVFQPLAHYYSMGLDSLTYSSHGYSRMTKRLFWPIFWSAWQKAMTRRVITSGFTKTGIYPFEPSVVLDQLEPNASRSSPNELQDTSDESDEEPEEPDEMTLATDVIGVRRLVRAIREEQVSVSSNVDLLIKSMESLIVEHDILRHEKAQLNDTLISELRRRKRGKPLGLIAKDEPKFGQFFSPQKIAARRQEIAQIESNKALDKQLAAEQKQQRQIERDLKAQEHRDRVEFNKKQREMKKAQKEADQIRKRRLRELKKALKSTKSRPSKAPRALNKGQKKSRAPIASTNVIITTPRTPITIARSGRTVTRPLRFDD